MNRKKNHAMPIAAIAAAMALKIEKKKCFNRNRKIQVEIQLYLFQMIKLRIPVGISSLHNCFLIGILHMTAEFLIF